MCNISFIKNMYEIFVLLLLFLTCIFARRFPEEDYAGYFDSQYAKTKTALEKLEHAPQWVPNWPDSAIKMGQVSGVALDPSGLLLVFHRATNAWDLNTFTDRDVYQGIGDPPIAEPTILVFNETGELFDSWGQNLFYIPHGITVDNKGNVWVTDVALHQVFKFTPENRIKPAMMLGEKFIPGDDDEHFCKPSAVAVLSSGDFFVADGYCNTRIVKFAADGTKILQWGKRFGGGPFVLKVPHALALAEDRGELCAADREHGRLACFRADSGAFTVAFRHWLVGPRLFSLAYAPVHGGRLYIVNGPALGGGVPVRGYTIDYTSGKLIQTFAPDDGFSNPHDIAVTADGSAVYVAELNPPRVVRFGSAPTTAGATVTDDARVASGAASAVASSNVTHVTATATAIDGK
ncbi:peptidyl-alpha-hydroxyglycine alpha-amidating lyase 1-like isoform X3 [Nymphalis io]|uniref:peptidyl-alpha-hydroxyglycine alpha-amidating lyase 1-like isoform X3 n=1 Tax=Inachis io TaxID=171585 RepID=UPI00216A96B0|nr:peptidyl-alpha-hydroxyglycine alpha-amidating lyase 1-like isoform X3 [Nymphalis io]XP_050345500.1 peptidyl-alpha-hydroxyglycine alpha-amidating lyase 1-like isoform X3 [Nymphalis io]